MAEFPVVDGHVDLIHHLMRTSPAQPFARCAHGPVTLDAMVRGKIRLIVTAIYCADRFNGPGTAGAHLKDLLRFAETRLTGLAPVRTVSELDRCWPDGPKPGTLFLLENADALVDLGVDALRRRDVRVVGLTHAGRNRIGDGNGVPAPAGLSSAGKRLVRDVDARGLALDVAHLSDSCFRDVEALFTGPLCSSHTGVRALCPLPRNLTDRQIDVIRRHDGVIGVTVNPEMLSLEGDAGLEEVVAHIDYVVQKAGPDHVGLGSDLGGFDRANKDIGDISALGALADRLSGLGYPDAAVRRVMGESWVRFHRSLLEAE